MNECDINNETGISTDCIFMLIQNFEISTYKYSIKFSVLEIGWTDQYDNTKDNCIHGDNCKHKGSCKSMNFL